MLLSLLFFLYIKGPEYGLYNYLQPALQMIVYGVVMIPAILCFAIIGTMVAIRIFEWIISWKLDHDHNPIDVGETLYLDSIFYLQRT